MQCRDVTKYINVQHLNNSLFVFIATFLVSLAYFIVIITVL